MRISAAVVRGLCGLLRSLASPLATPLLSPPPGDGTRTGAPGDVCQDVVGVDKLTVHSLCNPIPRKFVRL